MREPIQIWFKAEDAKGPTTGNSGRNGPKRERTKKKKEARARWNRNCYTPICKWDDDDANDEASVYGPRAGPSSSSSASFFFWSLIAPAPERETKKVFSNVFLFFFFGSASWVGSFLFWQLGTDTHTQSMRPTSAPV